MSEGGATTLTVRLVRSFEYRTFKNLVLHNVSLSMTVRELMDAVQQSALLSRWRRLTNRKGIQTEPGCKVYKTNNFGRLNKEGRVSDYFGLDTMKLFMKAHGSKVRFLFNFFLDSNR
jgi:hypothetical protein